MPKPTKGPRIGGSPAHQRIILANMASQLFEHGRITTTETRAKRVQPLAESLITKAKRGDLHARRLVLRTITDKAVVAELFEEIAPKMAGRDGGYTRITKIGNRKGDNAPMAIIELVLEEVSPKPKKAAAKKAAAKKAEEPKVDEVGVDEAEEAAAEEAEEVAEDVEAAEVEAAEATADDAEEAQAAEVNDDATEAKEQA